MKLTKYIQEKQQSNIKIRGISVSLRCEEQKYATYKQGIGLAFSKVPKNLTLNIKNIVVSESEYLKKRKLQALFNNGTIFLSDEHEDAADVVDDVVHEIAHSVEERYEKEIYSDLKIEKEFLNKRKSLWLRLSQLGHEKGVNHFLKTKYDREFDAYLYKTVGYTLLRSIAKDIFYSPYAATSLREYFANSFEAFFMKEEIPRLKRISPAAYEKNVMLLNMEK